MPGKWWDKLLLWRCRVVVRWLCNPWLRGHGGKISKCSPLSNHCRAFCPSRLTEESRNYLIQKKSVDWPKPACAHCVMCKWQDLAFFCQDPILSKHLISDSYINRYRYMCCSKKFVFGQIPYDTCCEINTIHISLWHSTKSTPHINIVRTK